MISIVTTVAALNTPMRVVQRSGAIHMGVADMEGTGPETGGKVFDPLGLSKIASEETLAWYRAAELKHSRVAMAAATGWAYVASGGPLFPGYISQYCFGDAFWPSVWVAGALRYCLVLHFTVRRWGEAEG